MGIAVILKVAAFSLVFTLLLGAAGYLIDRSARRHEGEDRS
jgi:hypothetical protein